MKFHNCTLCGWRVFIYGKAIYGSTFHEPNLIDFRDIEILEPVKEHLQDKFSSNSLEAQNAFISIICQGMDLQKEDIYISDNFIDSDYYIVVFPVLDKNYTAFKINKNVELESIDIKALKEIYRVKIDFDNNFVEFDFNKMNFEKGYKLLSFLKRYNDFFPPLNQITKKLINNIVRHNQKYYENKLQQIKG